MVYSFFVSRESIVTGLLEVSELQIESLKARSSALLRGGSSPLRKSSALQNPLFALGSIRSYAEPSLGCQRHVQTRRVDERFLEHQTCIEVNKGPRRGKTNSWRSFSEWTERNVIYSLFHLLLRFPVLGTNIYKSIRH